MLSSSCSPSLEAEPRTASFAATAHSSNGQANADGFARVASGAQQVSVPLPEGSGVSAPSVAAAAIAAPAAATVPSPDVPSDWCLEVDGPADAFPCGDAARCRGSAVLLGNDDPICKLLVARIKGIGHQVRVHLKGQPARLNRWYAAKDLRNSARHQQTVEELIHSARAPVAAAAIAASSTPRTSRKRAPSAAPVPTALHAAAGAVLSAHNAGAEQRIAKDGEENTHSLHQNDQGSKRRKLKEADSPAAVA